ncbi:MAG: hypothetical protein JSV04_06715 [Candidatus Heimdallarchaeota archaeon]|nr:MAG: hypothetical protein JSV04_06715 [Candidatus Heimdallarchaeota archaeon]
MKFQTYQELTITSKYLDIQKLINQDRLRIDLAAIHPIDGSIHFFEAETQVHVKHPVIYRNFCDYCYLLCPEEQFDILPYVTKSQQRSWAKETGVGVVTVSKKGELRVRLHAELQPLLPEIRKEVLRMMNKRYIIRFPTHPLWQRSRSYNHKSEG